MKRIIKTLIIIIFLICGCTAPPTIMQPGAQKNIENIRVLRTNTETLGAIALKAMDAVTKVTIIQQEKKVNSLLFSYTNNTVRQTREEQFTREVDNLRKEIQERRQRLTKDKFDTYLNRLLLEKPGVADVASDQKNLLQTLEELDVIASMKPELRAAKSRPYLADFYAVKQVTQARKDVMSALSYFIEELSKQGDLAEKHALAFLDFSKAEADPASIISGLARNQEFANAVGTIVLNRTNDEKRVKAAQDLIKTFTAGGETIDN